MIISPPFLPESGLVSSDPSSTDPMMDAVDRFELWHGVYPIAFDRRWHCGVHLAPDVNGPVYAIADGEIVASRVCQHAMDDGRGNAGFVLLRHSTDTGDGRTLTFYSLYMHLLPLAEYHLFGYDDKPLPECLRMPTGRVAKGRVTPAVQGDGKRVRRKEVLGYSGRYEGLKQLHFEIFTTPGDFDAYFDSTQLGADRPESATTSDYWGHTWFTIPAGQQFYPRPAGCDAQNRLHGIAFTPGQVGTNDLPLLVETYFSKGTKYTNVCSIGEDGSRTPLTEQPVAEVDYEYELYRRATALYSACPSDGYEMLRFGRILSTPVTLPEDARTTWVQITYAPGQQGYIDISPSTIGKFSDADFPGFAGWQKLSQHNSPFDDAGMCNIDVLKKLAGDAADSEQPEVEPETTTTEAQKVDALSRYVRQNDHVRRALRGFVCFAPSEWDSTYNDERYANLQDEGEFYQGNPEGYQEFIDYLNEIQFWDVTGLPAGGKLWYFHPLEFIRHFRKCGWLSLNEATHLLPRRHGMNRTESTLNWQTANSRLNGGTILHSHLCEAFRKYGIVTVERQTAFLSQVYIETGLLRTCVEDGRGGGSGSAKFYQAFYGRGLMQLTWPKNYDDYGKFRQFAQNLLGNYADPRISKTSTHYWSASPRIDSNGQHHGDKQQWFPRYDPEIIISDGRNCCDSAGFFWVSKHFLGVSNISRIADAGINTETIGKISVLVNGGGNGYDERQQYAAFVFRYRSDDPDAAESSQLTYQRLKIVSRSNRVTWEISSARLYVPVNFTAQLP